MVFYAKKQLGDIMFGMTLGYCYRVTIDNKVYQFKFMGTDEHGVQLGRFEGSEINESIDHIIRACSHLSIERIPCSSISLPEAAE